MRLPRLARKRPSLPRSKAVLDPSPTAGGETAIISINGRKFVTGLFWSPLSRARAYMAEARELGKKHDWDIVAIRRSATRIQAGFVSKNRGALKGMYSLASALAGVLGDKWIGVFEVGESRYAIVAVHDGTIVPGYDRTVTGFDEAKSVMEHGIALLDFGDNVYAPRSFNLALKECDLAEVLTAKRLRPEHKLKQLTFGMTRKEMGVMAILLLLVGAGVYGYGLWSEHREALRLQELKRQAELRERALKLLEEQAKKSQPAQALEHPWAHMPLPAAFAAACQEMSRKHTPLSIAGWLESSSECSGKERTVTYERFDEGLTVSEFQRLAAVGGARVGIEDVPTKATVIRDLSVPPAGDESLMDATEARLRIASEVQRWGDTVAKDFSMTAREVKVPSVPQPLPGQVTQSAPPPPAPTWREFTFEFKTGLPPLRHIENLKDVPGLRITSIKAAVNRTEASIEWIVKGDLYANL